MQVFLEAKLLLATGEVDDGNGLALLVGAREAELRVGYR
jgi:hypothetical protein